MKINREINNDAADLLVFIYAVIIGLIFLI